MMKSIGRLAAGVSLLVPGALLAQGEGALNASERSQVARILEPVSDIAAKSGEAVERRRAKYVADLKTLEVDVARSGDLEAVKAVRAEREAWENGESTPGFDGGGKFVLAKVATLRKQLDAGLLADEKQAKGAMEQETAKAIKALDRMKVELTRATRIDAALELEKQIQSFKEGTFEIAATGAGQGAAGRGGVPARLSGDTASNFADATKDRPFVNSLGMPFVPIKGTKVLLCIWETRVKDLEVFVKDSGYSWSQNAGFAQTPDDPAVRVSWDDAKSFCDWLSKKEGKLYRLPTDEEWDKAVGNEKYAWGKEWPPAKGMENIAGEESKIGDGTDPPAVVTGYRDDHPRTAPVGCYKMTKAGLYDMGGNVREWVEDWYTEALYGKHREGGGSDMPDHLAEIRKGNTRRVSRGGCWSDRISGGAVSSARHPRLPADRHDAVGFRCALATSSP